MVGPFFVFLLRATGTGIENLDGIMKIARIMLKINNFLMSLSRTAGSGRASLYLAWAGGKARWIDEIAVVEAGEPELLFRVERSAGRELRRQ